MDRTLAIVLTLLVGGLVAFQPPANELLARHVSDLGATLVSLTISWVIIAALLLTAGDVSQLSNIGSFKFEHALGGISGAAIVFISIVAVRSLGAGGVAALLVAGQLIISAVLDRLGVLGLEQVGLSATRLAGIGLLIAGAVLVTSR
jgi:transporter family-2 protein